jgi:hypothetical protein
MIEPVYRGSIPLDDSRPQSRPPKPKRRKPSRPDTEEEQEDVFLPGGLEVQDQEVGSE